MRRVGDSQWIPARVPGSVVADLVAEGILPDPYFGDNEKKVLECMSHDYEYCLRFDVEEQVFSCREVLLQAEGLDTVADLYINGISLAGVNNMHRTYEFSIKNFVRGKDNELRIIFHSPTKFIREAYQKDPVDGCEECSRGFVHLRKAHYMFGWDWGPRIPDAGIWRSIRLVGVAEARLTDVVVRQFHKKEEGGTRVSLQVEAKVQKAGEKDEKSVWESGLSLRTTVLDPDGTCVAAAEKEGERAEIFPAGLWWPNGLGGQPLYKVITELLDEKGNVLDTVVKRIGLRTVSMNRQKDAYGERFAHVVNGVEIFAMGADYIPEDNILSRTNANRTRKLLQHCADAHFNCIRVWGGGIYPAEDFYNACDELGLLVWQDFMFACGHYRLSPEFAENITAELRDNIRRLRHHASLGLFCGNNEMEMFTKSRTWNGTDALAADYLKMYEELFPRILEKEAPDVFYWPASPSSGGGFDEPNDENRGDVHYWEVWHGNRPFTEYRKFFFRYLSEFGFQSFPSVKTIESFTLSHERNIFSYTMEKHQRNAAANSKILGYLAQMYLYPSGLSKLVYASQLLQAEAIRYGVEHFRRNRGRCMGTVYWQLNDCWPVASWSSIDYFGRLKALHYFAKRFFAPVLLSCEENGMLGNYQSVNDEELFFEKSMRLCVTNDTEKDADFTVVWDVRDADAKVLSTQKSEVSVPAFSAVSLDKVMLPQLAERKEYVSCRLYENTEEGRLIGTQAVLFCPPKFFEFQDPMLSVRVDGNEIAVRAGAFAKSVHIFNENDDLVLSDNYFDMDGGEKRVKIVSGSPEKLEVESVYDIC